MSTDHRLILASRSPRRQELLRQIGVDFEVMPVDIPEVRSAAESPGAYVERVARAKARTAWLRIGRQSGVHALGADTEVVLDEAVFGKPADDADAAGMLARLAGRTHTVISVVCLMGAAGEDFLAVRSLVSFAPLDAAAIERYVASGEPRGKAGAYAIQGRAAAFVSRVEGSYSGVMGLPLHETAILLGRAGLF